MKFFISSEMKSEEDLDRRRAIKAELIELGHTPIMFEDLPARSLPDDMTLEIKCRNMVSECDAFILLVDDSVSPVILAELEEAKSKLGNDRIFYYFTNNKRDEAALKIWNEPKNGYIYQIVNTNEELRLALKRTISSFIEDYLKSTKKINPDILDELIDLDPGEESHLRLEFKKGDVIILTAIGNGPFYCGIFHREVFIANRSAGWGGAFNFNINSEAREFTERYEIDESDDYYLVLRAGALAMTSRRMNVRIRKEK